LAEKRLQKKSLVALRILTVAYTKAVKHTARWCSLSVPGRLLKLYLLSTINMNKNKELSSVTNEHLEDILKCHSKYDKPPSTRYESF
jgi:hypothetical protein